MSGLVFGIIEGSDQGWSEPATVGGFIVGAIALITFVLVELRAQAPMLDPRLFRLRGFAAGSLALVLAFSAAGLLVMSTLTVDFMYWRFALGLVLFAAGMGLAGTPSTTAIVSSLPAAKQGVASAVNDTSREFGSALGIAILGTILNSGYRSGLTQALIGLPAVVGTHARASIAFVHIGSQRLLTLGAPGRHLIASAKSSFVSATSTALLVAAAILFVGAVIVVFLAPRARSS